MLKKKLTPQHHWLSILPIITILFVAGMTLATAVSPGLQPRETFFDMFMRLDPRDVSAENEFTPALVLIDQESIERVGPWPWPRTVLAELVDSVHSVGAEAVVITVPTEGPDPLSPEVVGQYWFNRDGGANADIVNAVSRLPSNDVSLANSLAQIPAAVAIGRNVYGHLSESNSWARTDIADTPWIQPAPETNAGNEFLALPLSRPEGVLSPRIAANAQASVSALPPDSDGTLRRIPISWQAYERAVPSTSLAAVIQQDGQATLIPHRSVVRAAGRTVSQLVLNGSTINLDRENAAILYPPNDPALPSVSAWRVLGSQESWSSELEGNVVFIGETITADSSVQTSRGMMPRAQVHALMADQLADGVSVYRPEWAGFLEASLALLLGVGAILCALLLPATLASLYTLTLSVLLFILSWVLFSNYSILIDPSPGIFAVIGGQLGVVLSRFAGSIIRDDAVRGAFHGALPPTTMAKLQRNKAPHLLDGQRRQVTVLSCTVYVPESLKSIFVDDPEGYISYRAQTNDRLRQTILSMGGTVDFGEDGRLLGYWNVPEENHEHVGEACACALQMIEEIDQLTEDTQLAQTVKPARLIGKNTVSPFEQGRLEIGISSDVCFAGPVGRGNRNRYSVIGPAVAYSNLLRNRSRLYGPAIICDETVFTALRHHFAFLDLDILKVNDDSQPRPIYGLLGSPFLKASKSFRVMSDTQRAMVLAWREGDIAAAETYLKQLEEMPGMHEPYITMFRERIETARKEHGNKAPAGKPIWDGTQKVFI